ncbi:uncharacterized protein [Watersipora subatra]|uniref:uncharacterized protein n=1 Tax=Watersipora subatra TaxID=2589382 RepID=UPI00355B60C5
MQETEIDRDYISPDQPISPADKSPLAKLQETCRNIGSDLHAKPKDLPSQRKHLRHFAVLSKQGKSKLKKASSPVERTDKLSPVLEECPPSSINTPPASVHIPAVSTAADYNQYAASQYQLICQKLIYQKELENLQASMNVAHSYVPPTRHFTPDAVPPLPSSSDAVHPTDLAKLTAFFQHKLQQPAPVLPSTLTAATEALQNYNRIFSDNDNLKAFTVHQFKNPSPQYHECHWVTPTGICGKKHYSYEELMLHLASHASSPPDNSRTINPSTDSLQSALSPHDSLSSFGSRIISTLPNTLSSLDYQYNPLLETVLNKTLSKSISTPSLQAARYQPYSFPYKQMSVPFLH